MAFLNLSRLPQRQFMKAQALNESLGRNSKQHLVFLSYRRADREYVSKVVELLEGISKDIYVDYLDDELPSTPSSLTAKILRDRIKSSKKVIQLITPNSSGSKWMPWELGLGDGILGYPNAVTLPSIVDGSLTVDQEYLNIYGHIETKNQYASLHPALESWVVKFPEGREFDLKLWLLANL